jgi:hypothetical protein
VANGTWQHIAFTYDKTTGVALLYVNGGFAGQSWMGTLTPETRGPFYIGHRSSAALGGAIYFPGQIDEPAVYNRALTAQEVSSIYAAGATGKCTDSDFDGLLDAWEWRYFGSLEAQNAPGDLDQDGYSNLQEFQNGTDPTVADPRPRVFEPKPGALIP